MTEVYLGLGSNIGDREGNLEKACEMVGALKKSSIHETEPFGVLDQPKFLNMVCKIETELSPRELLNHVKNIEKKIGRKKREKWGPREIDIDILFYGDIIVDEPDLQIPHPGISEREFVLKPLREIAPDKIHNN
ncbi:MAG: 2-amino-4-hydroxy-6-hydroxymethyldihydropteridine diphosphokinase [Patescibacteria group bacterium]|nr:2-amino-4-hydroxy-6-hydroxymethyldihydropteridine diphosphokinase [Patescibacteria group bacterium]